MPERLQTDKEDTAFEKTSMDGESWEKSWTSCVTVSDEKAPRSAFFPLPNHSARNSSDPAIEAVAELPVFPNLDCNDDLNDMKVENRTFVVSGG